MIRYKKFDQLLKKEFSKTYGCDITTKDLVGAEFVKREKKFNINLYWKYSSICTSLLLVISLVCLSMIPFKDDSNVEKFVDSSFEMVYDKGLSEEKVKSIRKICDFMFDNEVAFEKEVDEGITMYIYIGAGFKSFETNNKEIQMVYLYAFTFEDNNRNVIINVDGTEIVVNSENDFGVLGCYDKPVVGSTLEVEFSLTYLNNTKYYLFMDYLES